MIAEGRGRARIMAETEIQYDAMEKSGSAGASAAAADMDEAGSQTGGALAGEAFCEALRDVDWSIAFILIILATLFLSLRATLTERRRLVLSNCGAGAAAEVPSTFPLRFTAGWMVIGALGFFFCLAVKTLSNAQTEVGRISAERNLAASALVLMAAMIRYADLWFVFRNRDEISEAALDETGGQPE